ncbi:glycosyltransferase family 9 protein [Pelotalea chapellei]|uniref:Glycosyltransferase family 9 protein n=1 Tax=Pelotalea chapellei TaxID=44671 RepID=A0ABS5U7Y4_9BACT|nr:glycosyltransferase family 9 protein [Pelotalea chapellei]MBT1071753.1 glycosyltransferase family 9 protein [Pelotalea chapellei]
MSDGKIVIYAEYCHDFAQRFSPLVEEIRRHYGSCIIAGVFAVSGSPAARFCIENIPLVVKPFDEFYCFPTPAAAAGYVQQLSFRELLVFIDHNVTVHDELLYASTRELFPGPTVLLRNKESVIRYLATGSDDHDLVCQKLSRIRSSNTWEELKLCLLRALAGCIIRVGKVIRAATGSAVSKRKQILFLRLDLLGDMIVTMPYLAAVKKQYPHAELTVLASSKGAVILREQAAIAQGVLYDHLEVWDAPWHREVPTALGVQALSKMLNRLPELWRRDYDIIVQPVNFGTGILFALMCLGKRVLAPIDPRLPLSLFLRKYVSDPVEVPSGRITHMNDFLALTSEKLGIAEDSIKPVLLVQNEVRERMRKLLAQKGHDEKFIMVNVGAGNKLRCWGSDNFGKLILRLLEHGNYSIALTGTKDDEVVAEEVEKIADPHTVNTTGRLNLNELVALTSLADLVITADTAVMHIAAALKKPVVAIFGAGLVDYCRPFRTDHLVVKNEQGCSGCQDRCFTAVYPPPCMEAVKPESVFDATVHMLSKNTLH